MNKLTGNMLASLACMIPLALTPIAEAQAAASPGFYDQVPGNLAGLSPGTLIASEPETNFLTPFRNSASASRILYRSTGQLGNPITVSGMVFVPKGTPPVGGWPIVAWGHGTSGVGDACAPSKWPDMYDNGQWRIYLDEIDNLLGEGYVVVASDYEGLGTPGMHTYLLADALGKATIDGVRATRNLIADTSSKWAAVGHSEGGEASIAAGEFATTYGSGLDYVGAAALAPANHYREQLEGGLANPSPQLKFSAPYLGYMGVAMSSLDQNFNYGNFLGPLYLGMVNEAKEHCFDEWFIHDNYGNQPTPETVLNANWRDDPVVQQFFTAMDNVGKRPGAGPVLIQQGTGDGLVYVLPLLVSDMCGQNTPIHVITYNEVGHDKVVKSGWDDTKAWLANLFAGSSVPNDCNQ